MGGRRACWAMAAVDPSEYLTQVNKVPGERSGKLGNYELPVFEGSSQIEVGGRDHMSHGGYVNQTAPEDPYGPNLGHIQRGKIGFEGSHEVQVGGHDHINDPRYDRDSMRAPEHLKGHMEPWLKKEVLPHIPNDQIEYEGSFEPDVGGRDHFGAGGKHGGWVPDNYQSSNGTPEPYVDPEAHVKNQRPHTPSARFARGEKVTPFHVKRSIRGPTGAPIGRESWDTIKHLPGLTNTRQDFKMVGRGDLVRGRFGEGFQRRREADIGQDRERLASDKAVEVRQGNQAVVRKKFIDQNQNRNTFNPITGDYWGQANNPAFQEMITRNEAALFQDRYAHHTKRAIAGPKSNGECSDCKPIPARRTKALRLEGMSAQKAATRGSVKQLFQSHDGYVVPRIPPKPADLHPLGR